MKKFILVLTTLLVGCAIVSAQDTITKKNGEDIKAVITEVNPTNVRYKDFDNPDGPVFTINKSDIAVVHYANGKNEVFNQSPYAAGQVVPKYKELKEMYDFRNYVQMTGDPYSPAWSGVASFFIPGLGQMICGEVGRGLAFLGGQVLAGGIIGFSYVMSYQVDNYQPYVIGTLVAGAAAAAIDIWAIVDAIQVAKVKDMYQQDIRNQYSFNVKMYPSVSSAPGSVIAPGITLAVVF